MLEPFSLSINTVADTLNSNIDCGLNVKEIKQRLKTYGKNEIAANVTKSRWNILFDQFKDPIIFILAIAAGLTFLFNDDLPETIAIITVILITVTIGFYNGIARYSFS
jgi:Ca2+-transporting ATPase